MTSAFSWQNSVRLCPASFCTPRPNFPVWYLLISYFFTLIPFDEKDIFGINLDIKKLKMTSTSVQDGLSRTTLSSFLKQPRTWTNYVKHCISRHWTWISEGQWSLRDGKQISLMTMLACLLVKVSRLPHREGEPGRASPGLFLSWGSRARKLGNARWLEFTEQSTRRESYTKKEL